MGGGPDPSSFNKPTEMERAQTETAEKMFDLYLKGKPVSDAYLKDITQQPDIESVQGQAAVDLAKKSQPTFDPSRGMNAAATIGQSTTRAKVMSDINQDATAQQAAGMRSAVENAMGIQSSANTAQAGLASDAVERNVNKAQSQFQDNAATKSSAASLMGAGAGMGMALFKKESGNAAK